MENINSEQHLKHIFDEGKISEEEYKEILKVLKKKNTCIEEFSGKSDNLNSKLKIGIIAIVLTLSGLIFPYLLYQSADKAARAYDPNMRVAMSQFLFLGLVIEIIGIILGVKSWRNTFGKIAAILSGTMIILAAIFCVLTSI